MPSQPRTTAGARLRILRRQLERHRTATTLRGLGTVAVAAAMVATMAAYEVERGDTLTSIAERHGTTVAALAAANDIDDPDLIYVGDQLVIPSDDTDGGDADTRSSSSSANSSSPGAHGDPADDRVHVVRAGESVQSIARANGISVDQLMAANGLTSPGQLMAGSRVRMAANGPAPGAATGRSTGTYTVARGDTLQGIAERHGVSLSSLLGANDIANANRISIGQQLVVPGTATGGFACPIRGATRFVNDWGVAKGGGRFHEGIDLHAARGTDIVAPVSGLLHQIDGDRGGLQFRLDGDDGYTYWGTHMDSFGADGRVRAGDVIGTVGDSGNARGGPTHLHLEAILDGESVNPYPTLAAVCG